MTPPPPFLPCLSNSFPFHPKMTLGTLLTDVVQLLVHLGADVAAENMDGCGRGALPACLPACLPA